MLTAAYILMAIITLYAVTLLRTYTDVPHKELRRRARNGDKVAGLLYRPAAYGASLQILLWLIISLSATGFFLLLGKAVSPPVAALGSLVLLWVGFAWLPKTRVGGFGLALARFSAPPLAWTLQRLYPLLNRLASLARKWRVSFHSGLYEKEDFLDLLDAQVRQADNRLTSQEIKTVKSALTFGDKIIRDIMIPPKAIMAVRADDSIGPILMTELHDSGYSRFPVYESKKSDNIVGILYLRDLMNIKSGGLVRDLMNKDIYYLHEEEPLDQALEAFLANKHHLSVVINRFEDIVGIVTIEDVLEQVIGRPIDDEFSDYQNPVAVARDRGHKRGKKDQPEATENQEEMVESEQI